jgi:uncharacterized protein with HEPN domain
MRNKLIHEYFGVNVGMLWVTIQEDIPFIKPHFIELAKSI